MKTPRKRGAPVKSDKYDAQIYVRCHLKEKSLWIERSKKLGYKSLASFIREKCETELTEEQ